MNAVLRRIEKGMLRLAAQQDEIQSRIAGLEARMGGNLAVGAAPSRKEVLTFLDGFRAGEALGEASLGAWIDVCKTPALRGALRTVQQREGMHARLLEERLKELGGSPRAEIPERRYERAMQAVGTDKRTDAEKLSGFVANLSDPDEAIRPILDMADRLGSDPETALLLRTIAQDERSTLVCLNELCAELNPV